MDLIGEDIIPKRYYQLALKVNVHFKFKKFYLRVKDHKLFKPFQFMT